MVSDIEIANRKRNQPIPTESSDLQPELPKVKKSDNMFEKNGVIDGCSVTTSVVVEKVMQELVTDAAGHSMSFCDVMRQVKEENLEGSNLTVSTSNTAINPWILAKNGYDNLRSTVSPPSGESSWAPTPIWPPSSPISSPPSVEPVVPANRLPPGKDSKQLLSIIDFRALGLVPSPSLDFWKKEEEVSEPPIRVFKPVTLVYEDLSSDEEE